MTKRNKNADAENKKVESWWNENEHLFLDAIKDISEIKYENISRDDLLNLCAFHEVWLVRKYPLYVPEYLIKYITDTKMFIKGLFYAVSLGRVNVAKHIYAQCKYRKLRNMPLDSLDRFDNFYCMIASDTGTYRHQGTRDGCIKAGTLSDRSYKERNKALFLRVLQHGPTNTDQPLICSVDGEPVENIFNYDPKDDKDVMLDEFDLHHAKFIGNTSHYYNIEINDMIKKTEEPSKYVSKWLYFQYTTQMVAELLSCVVISTKKHTSLHKLAGKVGGIDFWIKGWQNKRYVSIPYAWRSQEHYNEILQWISINCPNVTIQKLPSYAQFLEFHQHDRKLNSSSPARRSRSKTKTDPSEQTSNPCTV